MISVIVPLYNEEKTVEWLLSGLSRLEGDREILLADGGSTDRTRELAHVMLPRGARILETPRGRAAQSNAAAREARGETLFFLHADSEVAPDALRRIDRAVEKGAPWGCLDLRFDDRHPLMTVCAFLSSLRVRRSGVVFGDQGIFIGRALFREVGGFPEIPLMEDYELSLRLGRRGIFPVLLKCPITTSARRFRQGGRLRTMFLMWRLRRMYRRGCDMGLIDARYRQVR
jgi:rSAM/selenodomain-associated transferase 2